jgi:hypothetical protein
MLHTRSPVQTQRLSVGGTSARDAVRTRPHSFNAAVAGKCSGTICRIPVRPFVDIVKEKSRHSIWWLVTLPRTTPRPSQRTKRMGREIDALYDEMKAAQVSGFRHPKTANAFLGLRGGGAGVGAQAAIACRAPIEVRPFH